MPKQKKENNALYVGQDIWINERTGEKITFNQIIKKTSGNEFMITYLSTMINLIDRLGNKKMQVVKYILENMDKSTNTLIITTRELSNKTKVSKPVVLDTLKILEDAKIIARRTGSIMIHQHFKLINILTAAENIILGNEKKEKYLLVRFEE